MVLRPVGGVGLGLVLGLVLGLRLLETAFITSAAAAAAFI